MSMDLIETLSRKFSKQHGGLIAVCCSEDSELPNLSNYNKGLDACPEKCCRIVETEAGVPYLVCITGSGMVDAASAAAHLFDVHQVSLLVALGFMGRISDAISSDSILLVTKTANYASLGEFLQPTQIDPDHIRSWSLPEEIKYIAHSSAKTCQLHLEEGTVISAEGPLHDCNVGQHLSKLFSAVGVDMETAAIAKVAELRNRAWISVRIPSDKADRNAAKDHAAARERGIPTSIGRFVEVLVDGMATAPVGKADTLEEGAETINDAEELILKGGQQTVFYPFSCPDPDDYFLPRVIKRAFGVRVWDVRNRCYFDGVAGTKNVCLGHGHPAVFPYLIEQNSRLAHWSADGYTNEALVSFSEKLARFFPGTLRHVFSNSGGSEAVETALRMSREYHRCRGEGHRYKVIALSGGYHGATAGALSVTGHGASRSRVGPLQEGVIFVDPPTNGEPSAVEEALARLDRALELIDPESLSCVIFEPTQGLGGVRPLPNKFLMGLLEAARDSGALSIADEVASGLGRTGRWFDFTRVQQEPDIVVCGKALTNGTIPLSATVANDRVFDVITSRSSSLRHGHTYSGHPLAAAAACRVIDALEAFDVISRVCTRASEFQSCIAGELLKSHQIADVRSTGLWIGIELITPDGDVPHPIHRFSRALTKNGVIHEALGATIAISPPLTICRKDWAAMGEILLRTFREES